MGFERGTLYRLEFSPVITVMLSIISSLTHHTNPKLQASYLPIGIHKMPAFYPMNKEHFMNKMAT